MNDTFATGVCMVCAVCAVFVISHSCVSSYVCVVRRYYVHRTVHIIPFNNSWSHEEIYHYSPWIECGRCTQLNRFMSVCVSLSTFCCPARSISFNFIWDQALDLHSLQSEHDNFRSLCSVFQRVTVSIAMECCQEKNESRSFGELSLSFHLVTIVCQPNNLPIHRHRSCSCVDAQLLIEIALAMKVWQPTVWSINIVDALRVWSYCEHIDTPDSLVCARR